MSRPVATCAVTKAKATRHPQGGKEGRQPKPKKQELDIQIYRYIHTHMAQTDAEADKRGQQRRLAHVSVP